MVKLRNINDLKKILERWEEGNYWYLASIWTIRLFNRCCGICKKFRFEILAINSSTHKFSVLDLRSPNNTGYLFLLFFFQFSFFLWIKLGIFLLFLFAFVFFPLITHICFSLFESELCRTVAAKPRVQS
jgi:hypothetical protein